MYIKPIFTSFCGHDTFISDTGTQSSGDDVKQSVMSFELKHVRSGPHYLHSNGLVENNVKIRKHLLDEAAKSNLYNPYLALLNYRMAPRKHESPPADIKFDRIWKARKPALLETGVRVMGICRGIERQM